MKYRELNIISCTDDTKLRQDNNITLENKYNVDLVATYEEINTIPECEKITDYFGDLSLHTYKYGVTEKQIIPLYYKALEAIDMNEEEFLANKDLNLYRFEIVARMRDCLLTKTLLTGEEVLFINSEPIAGEDDFGYKTGFVMSIDKGNKTCTIKGKYFTMENVPLHNVLGKYNSDIQGMHYGHRNVEPLYGDNDNIAQFYIFKSKYDWQVKQKQVTEQEREQFEDCNDNEKEFEEEISGQNIVMS